MWIFNPTPEEYNLTFNKVSWKVKANSISEISEEVAQKYFLRFLPETALTPDNLKKLLAKSLRYFGKSINNEDDQIFLDQFKIARAREELSDYLQNAGIAKNEVEEKKFGKK